MSKKNTDVMINILVFAMKILLALLGLTFNPMLAHAEKIECGTTYVVKPGDTIEEIERRAYGDKPGFALLVAVNPALRRVIRNPNLFTIGSNIKIPCPPGMKSSVSNSTEIVLPPLPPSIGTDVIIVTGNNYEPYVGEDLRAGGMSVELIERALQVASKQLNYTIEVNPNWGTHLRGGLKSRKYQAAFPWFKPDCRFYARLGPESKFRCDSLSFSEPLHEVVVGFYGRVQNTSPPSTPQDLKGSKICRPKGYFLFDLEAKGLVAPFVKLIQPNTPKKCFEMLSLGQVDYVTVNADTADEVISALKINDVIQNIIDLATVQTLHAVTWKGYSRGRTILLRISQGLRMMKRNGMYDQIIEEHLTGRAWQR